MATGHENHASRYKRASLLHPGAGHDCREQVKPGTGRETGPGHAGGSATQDIMPRQCAPMEGPGRAKQEPGPGAPEAGA